MLFLGSSERDSETRGKRFRKSTSRLYCFRLRRARHVAGRRGCVAERLDTGQNSRKCLVAGGPAPRSVRLLRLSVCLPHTLSRTLHALSSSVSLFLDRRRRRPGPSKSRRFCDFWNKIHPRKVLLHTQGALPQCWALSVVARFFFAFVLSGLGPTLASPVALVGGGQGCTARRLALVEELRKKTSPPLAHGFQELAAGEICRGGALARVHTAGTARQRVLLPRVDVDGFFFSLRAVLNTCVTAGLSFVVSAFADGVASRRWGCLQSCLEERRRCGS
jgi:hypothetical protein